MEQNKIEIDINQVEVYDLENQKIEIPDFNKNLGNALFKEANSIEVSDIARAIHKGEAPMATELEISEIIFLLNTSIKSKAFIQKPLLEYLNKQLISVHGT